MDFGDLLKKLKAYAKRHGKDATEFSLRGHGVKSSTAFRLATGNYVGENPRLSTVNAIVAVLKNEKAS